MTLTLDVEHANSTSTLEILAPDALGEADAPSMRTLRIERKVIRQPEGADRAEAVVYRDAWDDVVSALDRRDDRFLIRDAGGSIIFGGRLADVERSDITVSVIIESGKRDAIDAAPSGGNDAYPPQPDIDILQNELLPRVGTVAAGSLNQQDASIAFTESHASPGKSITKLARDAGAEVRYEPASGSGFEIDYVDRLGSDRSGETLSPSAAKVLGEPRVRQRTLEDVTHVSVLGANSGGAQIEATAVVASFSAGDRAVHRRRVDKEIVDQSRAQKLADQLVAEYDGSPKYVEVECEIPTRVAPSLGDRFTVQIPDHDVNQTLRITMLERILDEAGDRFRALLTNRRLTTDLQGDQKALELNSLSEGNAGQIIRDSQSVGYTKVDNGEPQSWVFDFPDNVIGSLESKLRIESQPFRRPAAATGHSHGFSVSDHTHSVSLSTTETTGSDTDKGLAKNATQDGTLVVSTPAVVNLGQFSSGGAFAVFHVHTEVVNSSGDGLNVRLIRNGNVVDLVGNSGTSNGNIRTDTLFDWQDPAGNDYDVEVQSSGTSHDVEIDVWYLVVGNHTHDVSFSTTQTTSNGGATSSTTDSTTALQPGIVEETALTPSNVSVDVGGTTVVSGLSAPIQETVDISGVLSAGANTVVAKSDSLGELRTSITTEVIKNAGGP